MIGTPLYMSPEQAGLNDQDVDEADVGTSAGPAAAGWTNLQASSAKAAPKVQIGIKPAAAPTPAPAWTAAHTSAPGRAPVLNPHAERLEAARGAYQKRVASLGPLLQAAEDARDVPDGRVQKSWDAVGKLQQYVQNLVDNNEFVKAMPALDQIEHVLNVLTAVAAGDTLATQQPPTQPAGTGMITEELESRYQGEENMLGWRHQPKPQPPVLTDDMSDKRKAFLQQRYQLAMEAYNKVPDAQKASPDSDRLVTKYFDDQERDAAAAEINDGLVSQGGALVPNGKQEYIIDPQTGKMHLFNGGPQVETFNPQTGASQVQELYHSSVLAAQPVAGAGEARFLGGKVQFINNKSGHYKPNTLFLLQTVEHLLKQGAMLSDTLVKPDGKPLSEQETKLFGELQTRCEKLSATIQAKCDKKPPEETSVEEKYLAKYLAVLRKLGWGEENKVVGEVENLANIEKIRTGHEVHLAKGDVSGVQDFLRSGGAAKAKSSESLLDVKEELHESIKMDPKAPLGDEVASKGKFAGIRAGLEKAEAEAEERAERFRPNKQRTEQELVQKAEDLLRTEPATSNPTSAPHASEPTKSGEQVPDETTSKYPDLSEELSPTAPGTHYVESLIVEPSPVAPGTEPLRSD